MKDLRNSIEARSAEERAKVIAWTAKENQIRKLGLRKKRKSGIDEIERDRIETRGELFFPVFLRA